MKLLIVNDEELTADTLKEAIEWDRFGIDEVFTAYNANAARTCIGSENIDLVLCDIEMPGESGISLLQWTRDKGKAIECVFLTCHASFEYAKEAIGLNCCEYILLPAKFDVIGEAIRKAVLKIQNDKHKDKLREYGEIALQKEIDATSEKFGSANDPQMFVQAVKQYIQKNLGQETLSVSSVADHFFLHPVTMNRISKKQIGVPVSQYIMDERMFLAKRLLESGRISAKTVAMRVGYRYYSSFSCAFKKYYGYSPSCVVQTRQKETQIDV